MFVQNIVQRRRGDNSLPLYIFEDDDERAPNIVDISFRLTYSYEVTLFWSNGFLLKFTDRVSKCCQNRPIGLRDIGLHLYIIISF
jgi:hypothetical protein